MIREKTPHERLGARFASAGLGPRSAHEAATLLLETGMSFETAAVMGQRIDESCTATPATIQEAARLYRRSQNGPPVSTAWGRRIDEPGAAPAPPVAREFVREEQVVIDGVPHHEVVAYQPVQPDGARGVSEDERRTAWGRKVED